MTNLIAHALREFKAAGYEPIDGSEDGPDKWIQENVLELLELFSSQGHSGLSAGYCVSMFKKLALFEPLAPLQGVEDEWSEPFDGDDGTRQNKRCSHVSNGRMEPHMISMVVYFVRKTEPAIRIETAT